MSTNTRMRACRTSPRGALRAAPCVPFGPCVAEIAEDLRFLCRRRLSRGQRHDRLAVIERETGHDGVVVCKAAVAVQLDEVRRQAGGEVFESGRIGVARDLNMLPRRQPGVQLDAGRLNAVPDRGDLLIAGFGPGAFSNTSISFRSVLMGSSKSSGSVGILRRVAGSIRMGGHRAVQRSDTAPRPTICSTSATSVDEGCTRILRRNVRFDRSGLVAASIRSQRDSAVAAMAGEHIAERLEHAPVRRCSQSNSDLARQTLSKGFDSAQCPQPAAAPIHRRVRASRE